MAKRNSLWAPRRSLASLLFAMGIAAVAMSTSAGAMQPASAKSRSFGDTTDYGVRIVSINADSEVATIETRSGKHLIVIEVVPGRSIDILYPGSAKPSKLKSPNTFAFSMARYTVATNDAATEAAQRAAEDAQRRCQQAADAAARRAKAATRTRDASGKETGPTTSQVMSATADESSSGYRCSTGRAPTTPLKRVRMPPRAPADRYLVVLSTSSDISLDDLNERLSTLTSAGSDVATVIEATASGLLLGYAPKWGGAFIPW